jgi:hypothetical protein
MKTKTTIIAALLAASLHASAATTQIISVNFQGGLNAEAPTGTAVTSTAGYVPADNWNNATGTTGAVFNLIDSTGTTTITDVTWTTNNLWDLANGDGSGGDQDMMSGYLDNFNVNGPQTLTISGIQPNKGYDVYVYFNRGQETYTGITASDGINTNTYYARDNGSNYTTNGYMISSDDNIGDGWTDANVFEFTGYTGSTLDFSDPGNPGIPAAPGGWKVYVQGIQLVVTVPEPSSTALLGLGGLALMLRRKRS